MILMFVLQGKVTLMVTIPELRSIDCIFWSPAGRYCVLAQLYNLQQVCFVVLKEISIVMRFTHYFQKQFASNSGSLMFLDTAVNSNNAADYRLQAAEHPYATDVEWDPTGRYVVTYVSAWIRNGDNEYQVWSFLGRRLRKETKVSQNLFCLFCKDEI